MVTRRVIALVALLAAAVATGRALLAGSPPYRVHALFENASQLVEGDRVTVAGYPAGEVSHLAIAPDGLADVTLTIDRRYAPLRRGTQATVRALGLAGVANRYVALHLGSGTAPAIPSGGTLPARATTSAVDLDEVLNTLDPRTRRALQRVVRGSAAAIAGRSRQADLGWLFLDPALSTSNRLLAEIDADRPLLARFVVANARLATDLASRRDAIGDVVGRLGTTMSAVATRRQSLADALRTLPPFLERADATFAQLRGALADLRPLVDAAKPVARRLRPYLAELRPFAQDARPTVRDLARLISSPGRDDDLVDLLGRAVPLRDAAVGPVRVDGRTRPGALPATARALRGSTPELAFARPYVDDLVGWLDDFSHSGLYDALGSGNRVALGTTAFAAVGGTLHPVPPELRAAVFGAVAQTGQTDRCPGAMERSIPGSPMPWLPAPGYPCDPTQAPEGR